ncbi:unnamed protein product [Fusarium graminearum]|uniref:Chromosome 1, complete genome n=2 Tax=Gibberella zeae TaxID=5518 RepID=A0A098D0M8_GIBZE|nr:unnamed protein product [Fusarium graminearum]CAF3579541.1 unnamed protein product [Fusarium graminearum]CAF3627435.1 unnamed protein product [Fusarium graminearum]CAG1964479.1 unnamed protein product [Fusarium graminearum]CAG1997792.1 unnamed protein product [Fusarium graminearum]
MFTDQSVSIRPNDVSSLKHTVVLTLLSDRDHNQLAASSHPKIIVRCDRSISLTLGEVDASMFLSVNTIMMCARWTMAFVLLGALEGWTSEG